MHPGDGHHEELERKARPYSPMPKDRREGHRHETPGVGVWVGTGVGEGLGVGVTRRVPTSAPAILSAMLRTTSKLMIQAIIRVRRSAERAMVSVLPTTRQFDYSIAKLGRQANPALDGGVCIPCGTRRSGVAESEKLLELFPQRLLQRRHRVEQILDEPIIRYLEDRCLGILIDGDDHLTGAHARQVLNRP